MKHTVYIDDSTKKGKELVSLLRKNRKCVEFDNPAISGNIPEGYMTGEEFKRQVKEELRQRLEADGYFQRNS